LFGGENLDELLAGANHMQRQEWASKLGLGRHRISSTISISRAQQVEQQNIPPILIALTIDCSRDFGDLCSAISIGSWIFPEFLTKRPDEDVRLFAQEQSELVNP
jgi:hypothetical protein